MIRWADAAQENVPALEAPPLSSDAEWFEWILPGLNLVSPGFAMAEVSRASNPVFDPGTGRGERLASLLPWWLFWALAQFVGWIVPMMLWFFPFGSDVLDYWLSAVGGVLALLAAPFLGHFIVATTRQQSERHRLVTDPWRPWSALAVSGP